MKPLTPKMRQVLTHVAAGNTIYGHPRPYHLSGLRPVVEALRDRDYLDKELRATAAGRAALTADTEETKTMFGEEP